MIDRLRRALAPDYEIEREVAGGGMGVVFAAWQTRLDRRVAIKILRPELATAVATERFVSEGRLLAKLAHPAIVPIYAAGESDGLFYYVMEFVDGETLADRLKRGPLLAKESRELARDLLAALAAAHAQGVVHRDVKPANIFLRGGRALLGDFGIARWQEQSDGGLTTPGQLIGTPRYMSPEQRDGVAATPGTDVYQAALVLWEACHGERWPAYEPPEKADWSSIPPALAPSLRRGLALRPEDRFADSGAFLAAIEAADRRRPGLRVLAGVAGAALLGSLAWWLLRPTPPPPGSAGLTLAVAPFTIEGTPVLRGLGDSVAGRIAATLADYPDFAVVRGTEGAAITIRGTARLADGRLLLSAQGSAGEGASTESPLRAPDGIEPEWRAQADGLALQLVQWIFDHQGEDNAWLPKLVIPPRSSPAWAHWFKGEQLFSLARWEEALGEYRRAEEADTACLLCAFRLHDVTRWVGATPDSASRRRMVAGIGSFPAHYRPLVRAAALALPARLDTLEAATRSGDNFFLTRFEYGDELFHRGPLYGHRRVEAEPEFTATTLLRPRFGPAWEHLAWLRLSEGDSASTAEALARLDALPGAATGFSASLHGLLRLGFAWRFHPPKAAQSLSASVLSSPGIASGRDATAAARLLMTTDAPRGAVTVGGWLAAGPGGPDAVRNGLLGQLMGYAALGRVDSVRVTGDRMTRSNLGRSLPLLALELAAVLRAFDPDPAEAIAPDLVADLARSLPEGSAPPDLRRRAAFAAGLLAIRAGDSGTVAAARRTLRGDSIGRPLAQLLDAAALLAAHDSSGALKALPTLPGLDRQLPYPDPFADVAFHFLYAEAVGGRNPEAARSALRWHEHLQTIGHLVDDPEPGEMAWAVGTLARWKRLALLEGVMSDEQCRALLSVARLWQAGEARYVARADSARRVARAKGCPGAP